MDESKKYYLVRWDVVCMPWWIRHHIPKARPAKPFRFFNSYISSILKKKELLQQSSLPHFEMDIIVWSGTSSVYVNVKVILFQPSLWGCCFWLTCGPCGLVWKWSFLHGYLFRTAFWPWNTVQVLCIAVSVNHLLLSCAMAREVRNGVLSLFGISWVLSKDITLHIGR